VQLVEQISAQIAGAIEADRGQIEQVIMNLVINARDAMPNGGKLIIETSTEQLDEYHANLNANKSPGAYNVLIVTDTGVGMTVEVQDHIVEPFFTTKGVEEGTGLGLSTCYGIVTQTGGHITVDSRPGECASFKVFFRELKKSQLQNRGPTEKGPGPPETRPSCWPRTNRWSGR
jgi:signal transduction histidine kinase